LQAVAARPPRLQRAVPSRGDHTPDGAKLLRNFALKIAGFKGDWTVTDPETKRKTIGALFIDVFEGRARRPSQSNLRSKGRYTRLARSVRSPSACRRAACLGSSP
jgi:hypothetical protein